MIYRLKELQGDTIAVPQLVFSKLGIAEEYNVRVALYVLATGITDPDNLMYDIMGGADVAAKVQEYKPVWQAKLDDYAKALK